MKDAEFQREIQAFSKQFEHLVDRSGADDLSKDVGGVIDRVSPQFEEGIEKFQNGDYLDGASDIFDAVMAGGKGVLSEGIENPYGVAQVVAESLPQILAMKAKVTAGLAFIAAGGRNTQENYEEWRRLNSDGSLMGVQVASVMQTVVELAGDKLLSLNPLRGVTKAKTLKGGVAKVVTAPLKAGAVEFVQEGSEELIRQAAVKDSSTDYDLKSVATSGSIGLLAGGANSIGVNSLITAPAKVGIKLAKRIVKGKPSTETQPTEDLDNLAAALENPDAEPEITPEDAVVVPNEPVEGEPTNTPESQDADLNAKLQANLDEYANRVQVLKDTFKPDSGSSAADKGNAAWDVFSAIKTRGDLANNEEAPDNVRAAAKKLHDKITAEGSWFGNVAAVLKPDANSSATLKEIYAKGNFDPEATTKEVVKLNAEDINNTKFLYNQALYSIGTEEEVGEGFGSTELNQLADILHSHSVFSEADIGALRNHAEYKSAEEVTLELLAGNSKRYPGFITKFKTLQAALTNGSAPEINSAIKDVDFLYTNRLDKGDDYNRARALALETGKPVPLLHADGKAYKQADGRQLAADKAITNPAGGTYPLDYQIVYPYVDVEQDRFAASIAHDIMISQQVKFYTDGLVKRATGEEPLTPRRISPFIDPSASTPKSEESSEQPNNAPESEPTDNGNESESEPELRIL